MSGLNPAITNMVIVLAMTQLSKKIPVDQPEVLNIVRAVYILSNLIIAGVYFYVQAKINAKRDLTTLKYVEPAPMGSQEEPKLVTTTVKDYDLGKVREALRGQLMGIGMMAFMHLYMQYTNPLMIQSILPLKGIFENNEVKIHLLGHKTVGDLKRPFKGAGGAGLMGALTGQTGGGAVKTDKASIEAAERAGRGGAKEE